ncbi:MAG: hypothetical protein WC760_02970 [Bacteroidia bacterium]|jgi:hypothetical protein
MNIYKLRYNSKTAAIADLKTKGLLDVDSNILCHAVVFVGLIEQTPPIVEPNGDGVDLVTPATHLPGFHVDVMCEQDINFGATEIIVNNPKHVFA